jgi:hypothetical protein
VTSKEKNCLQCGLSTLNPKFCDKKCAAKYNNQFTPKRKKSKSCKLCSELIYACSVYCKDCYTKIGSSNNRGDITLQEAADSYAKHHKSSAFALVRTRARVIAKKIGLDTCVKCGYDKHVEIAHIKAISSFDMSTLISVVNAPENLMPLCPNCHWEHDHP